MVYNTARQTPGRVASYEDLWRFTLANYNAGPGCLSIALKEAWRQEGDLSWPAIARHFSEACGGATEYVCACNRRAAVNGVKGVS